MNKILAIAWKNILIRFSSRIFLIFWLILPLVFTFLLASAQQSAEGGDNRQLLLVVDEDKSGLSQQLLAELEHSEAIRPELKTAAEAEEGLRDQESLAILTIPAGFEQATQAGQLTELQLKKAPNTTDADLIEQAVSASVSRLARVLNSAYIAVLAAEEVRPFATEADRQAYFEQSQSQAAQLVENAPSRLNITQPAAVTEEYNGAAQQSAGQLVTWVFINLLGASVLFVAERTEGTLRRLLTTATPRWVFVLGMMLGDWILGVLQMSILVLFGVFVMGISWGSSPAGVALMLGAFSLASVAIGTLIGVFAKTPPQANNLSIMAGMMSALLGGCWWPIELFPEGLRTAVHLLPTTWAMEGFLDLMVRQAGVVDILPAVGALLLMGVLAAGASMRQLSFE
jgi:ABC-2 type transport system permease protein